jgi:hypothetical protein
MLHMSHPAPLLPAPSIYLSCAYDVRWHDISARCCENSSTREASLPCMDIEGFDGSLNSVFSSDPLAQRSCPGFHIAVGCGLLYGISQPLDRERAARDRLGTDAQLGHPPPPEGLVCEERHHGGGDAGVQRPGRSAGAATVFRRRARGSTYAAGSATKTESRRTWI